MIVQRERGSTTAAGQRAAAETVVVCQVRAHRFALPVADVVEVHRAVAVASLPGAPEAISGVVDVRGELVAVMDVAARLGLNPRPVAASDAFVEVVVDDRRLLLLVDAATDVDEIPHHLLQDAEELVPGARYVRDVARTDDGPLVIHDLSTFLSSSELSQLDQALRERAAEAEEARRG